MTSLLYKDDFDAARDRLTTWWQGGDIGRPVMQITARREEPIEDIPAMPQPEGWVTHYSTSDFDYRVNLAARDCINTHYLAEAMPAVSPCLGPNCLALYLGCRGVEQPGTVWFEPCIDEPDAARFEVDPDNFYWDFTLRLIREQLRIGAGRFLVRFPDLIEGLDTLAGMRGTETLLMDLIERPEWVRDSLGRISKRYFDYYDIIYDQIRDDRGGTHFWSWAPGRMAKFQCDFSAMISPDMFGDFMVPVLTELSKGVDYCMYHWDGPGAIPHHDHLLSVPELTALQWTPGAGAEGVADEKWWPLYHKTVEAGKRMVVLGVPGIDSLKAMKEEFGPKLKQFIIGMNVQSPGQADEAIEAVSD
ncbi:MAG: trimethylamine corrinoid protein 2 [Planctomycetes bacterium]|nr:trimethylamine corrinoid protein 2 [Planctomycetota bacterium]